MVTLDCRSFDQSAYAAQIFSERRELFSSIYSVAFVAVPATEADRDTYVAAAYSSGLVRLFEVKGMTSKWLGRQNQSGEPLLTWHAHQAAASGVKVIQAGSTTFLITVGEDGFMKQWDMAKLLAHTSAIAAGKADEGVSSTWAAQHIDPDQVQQIPRVENPLGAEFRAPGIVSMSIDEPNSIIYVGATDGGIHAYSLSDRLETFPGHAASILCLDFCSATNTLASGSEDGTIRLWDCSKLPGGGTRASMDVDSGSGQNCTGTSSYCTAIINPWDGVELSLNATPNELLQCFKSPHITALKFVKDGGWLVIGTGNAALTLWSLTLGQCAQQLSTQSEPQAIHTLPGEILVACAESRLSTYGFTIDAPPKLTELSVRSCYALDVSSKTGMVVVAGAGGCLNLLSPYGAKIGAVFPNTVDE